MIISELPLREKCPNTEVIPGFVFSCVWTEDGDLLRKSCIQCEYRKMRTRITPYLDTFHEE